VDVTVTVIVSTRNDYIFYSDRALKQFFSIFGVCKVTFVKNSRGSGAQARLSEPLTY